MLLQRPPVILGPADQLDEVAATKGQLEGGQLIQDAAQGPHISLVVVGHSTQDLHIDKHFEDKNNTIVKSQNNRVCILIEAVIIFTGVQLLKHKR